MLRDINCALNLHLRQEQTAEWADTVDAQASGNFPLHHAFSGRRAQEKNIGSDNQRSIVNNEYLSININEHEGTNQEPYNRLFVINLPRISNHFVIISHWAPLKI